jgi:hypothetical protein
MFEPFPLGLSRGIPNASLSPPRDIATAITTMAEKLPGPNTAAISNPINNAGNANRSQLRAQ